MSLIYVSSPYSASTPALEQANVDYAEEIGKRIFLLGHVPLIPHRISALWEFDERMKHITHRDWLEKFALPLLKVCDAILMAGEWKKSSGCVTEYEQAIKWGITIYEEIEELVL